MKNAKKKNHSCSEKFKDEEHYLKHFQAFAYEKLNPEKCIFLEGRFYCSNLLLNNITLNNRALVYIKKKKKALFNSSSAK